jgi:hypothetical protein
LPLEELLFGFGFGLYWSCVYEHVGWRYGQKTASGISQVVSVERTS